MFRFQFDEIVRRLRINKMSHNEGMKDLISVINRLHEVFTTTGQSLGLELPQVNSNSHCKVERSLTENTPSIDQLLIDFLNIFYMLSWANFLDILRNQLNVCKPYSQIFRAGVAGKRIV